MSKDGSQIITGGQMRETNPEVRGQLREDIVQASGGILHCEVGSGRRKEQKGLSQM